MHIWTLSATFAPAREARGAISWRIAQWPGGILARW